MCISSLFARISVQYACCQLTAFMVHVGSYSIGYMSHDSLWIPIDVVSPPKMSQWLLSCFVFRHRESCGHNYTDSLTLFKASLISICRYLYNNPFNCDCELSWLPAFLRNVPDTGPTPTTCAAPANLAGRDISTLLFICECNASTSMLNWNNYICTVSHIIKYACTMCLWRDWAKLHCLKQPCVCVLLHCFRFNLARTFQK